MRAEHQTFLAALIWAAGGEVRISMEAIHEMDPQAEIRISMRHRDGCYLLELIDAYGVPVAPINLQAKVVEPETLELRNITGEVRLIEARKGQTDG